MLFTQLNTLPRRIVSFVLISFALLLCFELKAQSIYYYHGWNARLPFGVGFVFSNNLPIRYWQNTSWNGFSFWMHYRAIPDFVRFGAISYSHQRDVAGYATGFASRDLATRASQFYCGQADCQPIAWVQGGCLALAKEIQSGRLNWAYHLQMHSAKLLALNMCQNQSSYASGEFEEEFGNSIFPQCELRSWVCS